MSVVGDESWLGSNLYSGIELSVPELLDWRDIGVDDKEVNIETFDVFVRNDQEKEALKCELYSNDL